MPLARGPACALHFEDTGGPAPPVLLVMGLGMTSTGWWRTAPVLAERCRVISLDNRGVGRSGRPPGPYSVPQMADDAAAVLAAAGVERAAVYGISLGGMIAQELALRHPERVSALVLAATTPGGSRHVPPDPETLAFFERRASMPAEEAVWASVPYNYAARTRRNHADRIGADIVQRLRYPIEPSSYSAQLAAAMGHDAGDRVREIAVPTLVVHGEEDRMVVPANGRTLAEVIPGARLETWAATGHLLITDEPEADRSIARFLSAPTSPGP